MNNNPPKNPHPKTKTPNKGSHPSSKESQPKYEKPIQSKRILPKDNVHPPPSHQVGSKAYVSQSEANIDLLYCQKHIKAHPSKQPQVVHANINSEGTLIKKPTQIESSKPSDNNTQQQPKKLLPKFKNSPNVPINRSPIKITINLHNDNPTILNGKMSPILTKKQTLIQYANKDKEIPRLAFNGRRSPVIRSSNTLYDKLTGGNNQVVAAEKVAMLFKEYSYDGKQNSMNHKTMEDYHCVIEKLGNDINKSLFGIFDGHGGNKASIYCKENFPSILIKHLHSSHNTIEKSITLAFEQIDKDFLTKVKNSNQLGTTATIVYLCKGNDNQHYIYCANVGDSKCVLFKMNGSYQQLTVDHICSDKMEVDRIKKAGGMVFNNRVFGSLMITRSIGDKDMKDAGVIATPSIKKVEINNKEDKYIIIGSDGLWDMIKEERMKRIGNEDISAEMLSKQLVNEAVNGGSMDDVSCIVIKLK